MFQSLCSRYCLGKTDCISSRGSSCNTIACLLPFMVACCTTSSTDYSIALILISERPNIAFLTIAGWQGGILYGILTGSHPRTMYLSRLSRLFISAAVSSKPKAWAFSSIRPGLSDFGSGI